MSTLTIRNVDATTHARLRELAAAHGRSVEAEVRSILDSATHAPDRNLLLALHDAVGADATDLQIAERVDGPRPVDLP